MNIKIIYYSVFFFLILESGCKTSTSIPKNNKQILNKIEATLNNPSFCTKLTFDNILQLVNTSSMNLNASDSLYLFFWTYHTAPTIYVGAIWDRNYLIQFTFDYTQYKKKYSYKYKKIIMLDRKNEQITASRRIDDYINLIENQNFLSIPEKVDPSVIIFDEGMMGIAFLYCNNQVFSISIEHIRKYKK